MSHPAGPLIPFEELSGRDESQVKINPQNIRNGLFGRLLSVPVDFGSIGWQHAAQSSFKGASQPKWDKLCDAVQIGTVKGGESDFGLFGIARNV